MVRKHLPTSVDEQALLSSLHCLCLGRLTTAKWRQIGWVIAANIRLLQAGKTVTLWSDQPRDEWVIAQCLDAVECRTKYGKVGAELTFSVLSGTPASLHLKKFWSARFSQFLARKIGFTRLDKELPFHRITEFVGLRLLLLIDRHKSLESPYFDKVDITSNLLSYNRRLLRARMRIGFKCPGNFRHPCYLCPLGYDKCGCAVHPRTYVRKLCSHCGQNAWADPVVMTAVVCVECARKERFKRG